MRTIVGAVSFCCLLGLLFALSPKKPSDQVASFYQKGSFLVMISQNDDPRVGTRLDEKLVEAQYRPVERGGYYGPSDAIVGISRSGITVTPGQFFCWDGRYADADMPTFTARNSDEVIRLIDAIQRTQRKICTPEAFPVAKNRT